MLMRRYAVLDVVLGLVFRTSASRRFTLLDCFRGGQDGRRPGAEPFPGALTLVLGAPKLASRAKAAAGLFDR
jgi:hypothetical protein